MGPRRAFGDTSLVRVNVCRTSVRTSIYVLVLDTPGFAFGVPKSARVYAARAPLLAYQTVRAFVRLARRRTAVRTSGPQRVKCAIGGPDSLSVNAWRLFIFVVLRLRLIGRGLRAQSFHPPVWCATMCARFRSRSVGSTAVLVTWFSSSVLGALLLAEFVNQTGYIAPDDATGLGLGLGYRVNSLPMVLGSGGPRVVLAG
jgi:hypothetical protein